MEHFRNAQQSNLNLAHLFGSIYKEFVEQAKKKKLGVKQRKKNNNIKKTTGHKVCNRGLTYKVSKKVSRERDEFQFLMDVGGILNGSLLVFSFWKTSCNIDN